MAKRNMEHGSPRRKGRPAISVHQPFAYAIMHLGKDVENKPMLTHHHGRILIQASLRVERDEALNCKLDPDELPTGA